MWFRNKPYSDDADNQPGTYEICVLDCETYTIRAENQNDAKIQAMDCFFNDDYWMGKDNEGHEATINDCKIMSFEKD